MKLNLTFIKRKDMNLLHCGKRNNIKTKLGKREREQNDREFTKRR